MIGLIARISLFPSIPPELNRDEAALGYNAYSILKTGSDEWGARFPITFRSFGDYKLPGYIYTLVPFIATFGLTPLAVRLPSLFAGIALIPLAYFFTVRLTKNKNIGYATAFLLAISPWAIHYSRVGFEANLALALLIGGVIPLLSKEVPWKWFLFSLVCLFVSFMTYNTPLILFPFILGALCMWKFLSYRQSFLLLLVGIISFALILPATRGKGTITVFSDQNLGELRRAGRMQDSSIIGRIQYSPFIFYLPTVTKNYLATFSPSFLVTQGGRNPWHQPSGASHMTWPLYFASLFGVVVLIFTKRKGKGVILSLVVIAPIASSITTDAPHATRSLLFFFMLVVCAGVGLEKIFRYKKILGIVMLGALLTGFFTYMRTYLVYFPAHPQQEWNTGISLAIQQAESIRKNDEVITIVGDTHYSYIYPLFALHQDPGELRKTEKTYGKDVLGFTPVQSFSHYRFVESLEKAPIHNIIIFQKDPLTFAIARTDGYGKISK
ncbi:MAG: hypothetical protein A2840_02505 [Candidatus Buchananbacteria bacterium RIFCSPHIGHO2_01_FULL_47_11b]|uniref:Glycosyltransferase RgtA/B/C/D-like domain-containing protein n=1 Tax=Candidatus Buchananbacteria bacterium RIFCSPHIGHO2_01_FULL_47_11b TaxID=1797537 RepID=A0A1G1Y3Q0_9BACT|nr:MAG: hypothetical protein A2840_02505 [Candidatus Buchananbacteria bacterium RIFCSPHIGHO2_01_FULL_47_11b]